MSNLAVTFSCPAFQNMVNVSLLPPSPLWVLLLLIAGWLWAGSHSLLFISASLEAEFLFSPKACFTYSQSFYTSKHNLKYAFLMKPSKRKILDSHSTHFSQNFTFLRICWSGLCKISTLLKQTIQSSWAGNAFHILTFYPLDATW